MTEHDRVLNKIQACQALSTDGGATSAEQEIALRHALLLMVKFNVTESDIAFNDTTAPSIPPHKPIHETKIDINTNRAWARRIADAVARLYFCRAYYKTRSKTVTIVGSDFNRRVVEIVMTPLIKNANSIANAAWINAMTMIDTGIMLETKRQFKSSFFTRYAYTILTRCVDLIDEIKEGKIENPNNAEINLPAVINLYASHNEAVATHLAMQGVKTRQVRTTYTQSASGARAGQRIGNKAAIRQSVN